MHPVHSTTDTSNAANELLQTFHAEKASLTAAQYEEYAKAFAEKRFFLGAYEVVQAARAMRSHHPRDLHLCPDCHPSQLAPQRDSCIIWGRGNGTALQQAIPKHRGHDSFPAL